MGKFEYLPAKQFEAAHGPIHAGAPCREFEMNGRRYKLRGWSQTNERGEECEGGWAAIEVLK
jgi:hypothetical protein